MCYQEDTHRAVAVEIPKKLRKVLDEEQTELHKLSIEEGEKKGIFDIIRDFFMRLLSVKTETKEQETDQKLEEQEPEKQGVAEQLEKLPRYMDIVIGPYKASHYDFEVFECFRKVATVGLPVFFYPGQFEQLVLGLLVSGISMMTVTAMSPYRLHGDNVVAVIAQVAIFCSLLSGVILHADLGASEEEGRSLVITVVLSILSIAPFACTLVITLPGLNGASEEGEGGKSNSIPAKIQRRLHHTLLFCRAAPHIAGQLCDWTIIKMLESFGGERIEEYRKRQRDNVVAASDDGALNIRRASKDLIARDSEELFRQLQEMLTDASTSSVHHRDGYAKKKSLTTPPASTRCNPRRLPDPVRLPARSPLPARMSLESLQAALRVLQLIDDDNIAVLDQRLKGEFKPRLTELRDKLKEVKQNIDERSEVHASMPLSYTKGTHQGRDCEVPASSFSKDTVYLAIQWSNTLGAVDSQVASTSI